MPDGTRRCCASNWSRSKQEDFDLDLVGFTDEEMEELLRDPEETQRRPDRRRMRFRTSRRQVVTVLGDVWMLGEHRLLCGDATQMADIEKVLAGGLADMVFHRSAV